MSNQISRFDVQFSPFPEGFCPQTPNDEWIAGAKRLIVTPAFGFYGINIGPSAPANTDIPWFNTVINDWMYFSTISGSWVPVRPSTITGEVGIGTVLAWDGQIAQIATVWGDRWLFANGDTVNITSYPDYFAMVGTKWGGDGITNFKIIDARNRVIVGADQDVAGQAQTLISDGSTLTTKRDYVKHRHDRTAVTPNQGFQDLAAGPWSQYTGPEVDDNSPPTGTPVRVLPPYVCTVPIVRVK